MSKYEIVTIASISESSHRDDTEDLMRDVRDVICLGLLLVATPGAVRSQSTGPFVAAPHGIATLVAERPGIVDAGFGLGLAAGWMLSPKWGVVFVGDLSWMNVNRAPLDYFLGMMALSARRRAGTFAGAPLNLSVGPVTWEADNSGLGILAGADVETDLWTGRRTLVALELLYFAPASWRGENPATELPNTTTNDPRLALRLRFGRLFDSRPPRAVVRVN